MKLLQVISNETVPCRYVSLEEVLDAYRTARIVCPECEKRDGLSDNGAKTHTHLSFCCEHCGYQFDAADVAERES